MLIELLLVLIRLLLIAIFGRVIISWLLVVGIRNEFVLALDRTLATFTNPVMRPIRRITPSLGTIDLSPMIAIILLVVLQRVLIAAG